MLEEILFQMYFLAGTVTTWSLPSGHATSGLHLVTSHLTLSKWANKSISQNQTISSIQTCYDATQLSIMGFYTVASLCYIYSICWVSLSDKYKTWLLTLLTLLPYYNYYLNSSLSVFRVFCCFIIIWCIKLNYSFFFLIFDIFLLLQLPIFTCAKIQVLQTDNTHKLSLSRQQLPVACIHSKHQESIIYSVFNMPPAAVFNINKSLPH